MEWVGYERLPVVAANHFYIMSDHDGSSFVLLIGHVAPPVLSGSAANQTRQLDELHTLPVNTLLRVALTDGGVSELRDVLDHALSVRAAEKEKDDGE